MPPVDEDLDNIILYLRAYKQRLRNPYIAGLDSREDLESKIKPLFVELMGYDASLKAKEEEEKHRIDARLRTLLNQRIGEKTMEEGHKAIIAEVAGIKSVIKAIPKINPGEREIKTNLRQLEKEVKKIEKAVTHLSRKPMDVSVVEELKALSHKQVNVNLAESETMKEIKRLRRQLVPTEEIEDIYITWPANGTKKTVTVGTLVIDFLTGEVTLADGSTEQTSNRLENTDFDEVKSLSVDVNKSATITLDSGGKYPIGANQLFSIERQKFRTAYIEISETTEVTVWASTNIEGAVRVEKPSTIDTDERRYTRMIEYSGDNPEYIGEAVPGSSEDDAVWRIQYIAYSGSNPTSIKWADGTEKFTNKWSDRKSYVYT
jgi:hypothetical protein